MAKVIIHVGLHKTGTTFLQKEIFPKLKGVKFFDKKDINFNIDLSEEKINLISSEQLSGSPHDLTPSVNKYKIADRLHGAFPEAGIIVVFRDKQDWVKSVYGQYIKSFGVEDFETWYNNIFKKEELDFEKYKRCLTDLFKHVLVCQYEDLKTDPDGFVKKICDFIGTEVPNYKNREWNVRKPKNTNLRRKINKVFKSPNNPDGIISYQLPRHLYLIRKKWREKWTR